MGLGEYTQAIPELVKANEMRANWAAALFNLGGAYLKTTSWTRAYRLQEGRWDFSERPRYLAQSWPGSEASREAG